MVGYYVTYSVLENTFTNQSNNLFFLLKSMILYKYRYLIIEIKFKTKLQKYIFFKNETKLYFYINDISPEYISRLRIRNMR